MAMFLHTKRNWLIKTSILIITITFYLCFSMSVNAANTKIVMYGDSVSAGYGMQTEQSWPYLLQQTFVTENAPIRLINESISGETTGGGLARIETVLKRHELTAQDWIIIELGGNDGLRGFPIKTLNNNLSAMIKAAKARDINVALMQVRIPPNYGKRYTSMFENTYSKLANEYNLPLLPFFMEKVATNPNYMMRDGIHPNVSAQIIIRDEMKQLIENLVAD